MSEIKQWSEVDASNTDTTKSGMPEGMPRSDVNDRGREHMGALRRWYDDAEWVDLISAHGNDFTFSIVNVTTIRVTDVLAGGTDARSKFPVGTWVKINITGGPTYGSVVSASYSAPHTDVVLTEIVGPSYASAEIDGLITGVLTYNSRRVRSAAFSKVGVTLLQTPPEIPSIDLLKPHVLKDEGADGGIDADKLDGQHLAYFTDRDLAIRQNVLANAAFDDWSRGTTITAASTFTNVDGNTCADEWVILYDGADKFDFSRHTAGNADGELKGFTYALKMTADNTTAATNSEKGGIVQILSDQSSRPLVLNGKASLSFYCRTTTGDSIGRARCSIIYSTAADPPTDVVSAWLTEGANPTLAAGWNLAGASTTGTVTDVWTRFSVADVTIPATAINVAAFIWIDDTGYASTDEFLIAGAQLEVGSEVSTFRHRVAGDADVYRSGLVSGDGTYIEIVSPSIQSSYSSADIEHGFGRVPRFISGFARVKTGQSAHGYEAGEVAFLGLTAVARSHNGWTIGANATYIWWDNGDGGIHIISRADQTNVDIGPNDTVWELVIQAWK